MTRSHSRGPRVGAQGKARATRLYRPPLPDEALVTVPGALPFRRGPEVV